MKNLFKWTSDKPKSSFPPPPKQRCHNVVSRPVVQQDPSFAASCNLFLLLLIALSTIFFCSQKRYLLSLLWFQFRQVGGSHFQIGFELLCFHDIQISLQLNFIRVGRFKFVQVGDNTATLPWVLSTPCGTVYFYY